MRETKIIVKCDKCGAEITSEEIPSLFAATTGRESGGVLADHPDRVRFDLCKKCMERVQTFIMSGDVAVDPEQDEPEAEPEKPKPRQKMDTGKMQALHEAGWSYKAIAEEMKIPYSTVYNTLNYALKKKGEQ